jgi:hypothetical protein
VGHLGERTTSTSTYRPDEAHGEICCLTCWGGRSIGLPRGQYVIAEEGAEMRAGGVRPLGLCSVCGKLGDEQTRVKVGPMKSPAHDSCVLNPRPRLSQRVAFRPKVVG